MIVTFLVIDDAEVHLLMSVRFYAQARQANFVWQDRQQHSAQKPD
jgi:hypothetical protein